MASVVFERIWHASVSPLRERGNYHPLLVIYASKHHSDITQPPGEIIDIVDLFHWSLNLDV